MKVQLYNYTGEHDTVNKTLGTPVEVDGKTYQPLNVETPVLTLRAPVPFTFNYVYVPVLKRYYFVTGYTVVANDKVQVNLTCDVLKTYENEILQATGTVTQSENANGYLSNRNDVYSLQPSYLYAEFPKVDFFNTTGTLVMVTIKGNV